MRWWVGDHLGAKMATGAALRQRCLLIHSPHTRLKGKEQQAAPQTVAMPLGARWPTKGQDGLCGGHLPPPRPPTAPRSPSRPLVAPTQHHNRPRPHSCGGRNGPAVPQGKRIPVRTGMNFQHAQPFPPVHKLLADVAQKQAPCGAGRAGFSSRGNESKFSPHLSSLSQNSMDKGSGHPCSGLCHLQAAFCKGRVVATGSSPRFGGAACGY